jgi:hypothetical protein
VRMNQEDSILYQHAERAAHYHGKCLDRIQDSAIYAYLAGKELIALKEKLPWGRFMVAYKKAGIGHNTVSNYIRVAQKLDAEGKFPMIGNLQLWASTGCTPADREKISKEVHEALGGKTLTSIYRTLGAVNQPDKPDKDLGPKPADAEMVANDLTFQADQLGDILANDLERIRDMIHVMSDRVRDRVLDEGVTTNNLIREFQKCKPPKVK